MDTAVALGNFDGVSKAHAAIIRKTVETAKARGLRSVAYIIEPHPRTQRMPEKPVQLLTPLPRKIALIESLGVDFVHIERRGQAILELSPAAFLKDILIGELQAAFLVAGFNYRFGKNAAGDADLLKTLAEAHGISCEIVPSVLEAGAPQSSTRLRALLEKGDVESVNRMSYAPYAMGGVVEKGKQLGRTLSFPTINIAIKKDVLIPRKGVYISRTKIGGRTYEGITNIGENPTVEHACVRMESHLFDYTGDAYGQYAETTLLQFVRPEMQFASLQKLSAQIAADKETAIIYFKEEKKQ